MTSPNILVQAHADIQGILDRLGITTQFPFELIPVVLPTIPFERPTPTTENIAWGRQTSGPVALENSHCGLFNPLGSGKLLHVDSAIVSAGAATPIQAGEHDTVFTTAQTLKDFRDRRVPGIPVGITAQQTNVGSLVAGEMLSGIPAANTPFLMPLDLYMGEGQGCGIVALAVNVQLTVGWYWEELIPAEL